MAARQEEEARGASRQNGEFKMTPNNKTEASGFSGQFFFAHELDISWEYKLLLQTSVLFFLTLDSSG